MNSQNTLNATFLTVFQDGPLPSHLPDGLKTDQSGVQACHASPSALLEKAVEQMTKGTCGPSLPNSSEPASLQSCLASRLQARLAGIGSPEYSLTWKEWLINGQEPICALRASVLRTSDNACSGWPTPDANAMNDGESLESFQGCQKILKAKHGNGNGAGMPIAIAAQLAGWPTPDTGSAGGRMSKNPGQKFRPSGSKAQLTLNDAAQLAGWPTATTRDWKSGKSNLHGKNARPLSEVAMLAGGVQQTSNAETGKPAASRLNPLFSLWLMGYSVEWGFCGAQAMQSFPKSRRSSLPRSLNAKDRSPSKPKNGCEESWI